MERKNSRCPWQHFLPTPRGLIGRSQHKSQQTSRSLARLGKDACARYGSNNNLNSCKCDSDPDQTSFAYNQLQQPSTTIIFFGQEYLFGIIWRIYLHCLPVTPAFRLDHHVLLHNRIVLPVYQQYRLPSNINKVPFLGFWVWRRHLVEDFFTAFLRSPSSSIATSLGLVYSKARLLDNRRHPFSAVRLNSTTIATS